MNPIDLSYDPTIGAKVQSYLIANRISPSIRLTSGQLAVTEVTAASDILKASITSDTNLTDAKRKNFSFTIETMLVSCFFNDIECHPSDFKVTVFYVLIESERKLLKMNFLKWFWTNDYGNCYTFNAMYDNNGTYFDTKNISKPGLRSGLFLFY